MRGADSYSESVFTTVRLEDFVPANHPLRPIRTWVNDALTQMDAKFSAMYEADIRGGRRQGLRHEGLRQGVPRHQRDAACGAENGGSAIDGRTPRLSMPGAADRTLV